MGKYMVERTKFILHCFLFSYFLFFIYVSFTLSFRLHFVFVFDFFIFIFFLPYFFNKHTETHTNTQTNTTHTKTHIQWVIVSVTKIEKKRRDQGQKKQQNRSKFQLPARLTPAVCPLSANGRTSLLGLWRPMAGLVSLISGS